MTPQELKNSILQLAIQGKLVEQRPEEGTAEELYKQIQAEKQALIKAGKLKKEKTLPEITEDEKPFEIPESWKWVRLSDLCSIVTGKRDVNFGTPDGEYFFFTCARDPIKCSSFSFSGESILLAGNGDIGNISYYWGQFEAYQRTYVLQPYVENSYLIYLFHHLQCNWVQYNRGMVFGTAIPYIRLGNVQNYPVAFPPIAEQKRIIAKIEELLPLIDRYEQAWNRLEDLNKRFPMDLQKSILQLAIQGKLVPQRPEEGTGEELYQQIQAEKQALIKAGKLKKEKPLPEITEDDKPFDIPESWKWIQIGEICTVVTGRLDANAQDPNGAYPFFTCGIEVYKTKDYAFDCDAVLLGGNNASGDYKMHRYDGKFNAYQRVYVITDPPKETLNYLFYVIKWWLPSLKHISQGTTTRFIKLGQVTGMLSPFPPLAEQKRIVAKLEELLTMCEGLK